MRILICCNHSWPHVGGSERVIQQIAEAMVKDYGHEVSVVSCSASSRFSHNGVSYLNCAGSKEMFFEQLKILNPEHIFVYSDCFRYWTELLRMKQHPCRISIALVGMNKMIGKNECILLLKEKKGLINCITHSDNYQDYMTCFDNGIPVEVIPNGIDLNEFDSNDHKFVLPDKDSNRFILCVSNFFPGKGQEHLVHVLRRLYAKRQDWSVVFMSTTVNFPLANYLRDSVKRMLSGSPFKSHFLVNQSRENTIAAFKSATAFAFPSQKEVAPLVALEAQASKLPWVALPVGNTRHLKGGFLLPSGVKDSQGYLRYTDQSYDFFARRLDILLEDEPLRQSIGQLGRKQVEQEYNWSAIAEQYNKVFVR
jgi:glycosyltransferase involved in cell wall biosynthesis